MNCKRYSLKDLCHMYMRFVCTNVDGIHRVDVHECISKKTGISYEDLKPILHHLDVSIGMEIKDFYNNREIAGYARRLYNKLKRMMIERAKDKLRADGDTMAFFKEKGIILDEWLDDWVDSGMKFNEKGEPIIEEKKRLMYNVSG